MSDPRVVFVILFLRFIRNLLQNTCVNGLLVLRLIQQMNVVSAFNLHLKLLNLLAPLKLLDEVMLKVFDEDAEFLVSNRFNVYRDFFSNLLVKSHNRHHTLPFALHGLGTFAEDGRLCTDRASGDRDSTHHRLDKQTISDVRSDLLLHWDVK